MGQDSTATISGSAGYIITGTAGVGDRIVSVRRNGIECDEMPKARIYAHSGALTTDSLFAGSTIFPKFYIQNGRVFIKPNPTTAALGKVTYIPLPNITSATANTSLDTIENPMLLYAAALDCMAASSYWTVQALGTLHSTALSARAQDALDKAKVLIDASTSLSQGEDAEYFLAQEDVEMIEGNVRMAAQEINRALAEMKDNDTESQYMAVAKQYSMEYLERGSLLFKQAQQELGNYVNMNSKMLGLNAMLQSRQGGGS